MLLCKAAKAATSGAAVLFFPLPSPRTRSCFKDAQSNSKEGKVKRVSAKAHKASVGCLFTSLERISNHLYWYLLLERPAGCRHVLYLGVPEPVRLPSFGLIRLSCRTLTLTKYLFLLQESLDFDLSCSSRCHGPPFPPNIATYLDYPSALHPDRLLCPSLCPNHHQLLASAERLQLHFAYHTHDNFIGAFAATPCL